LSEHALEMLVPADDQTIEVANRMMAEQGGEIDHNTPTVG
jgi:hypothetical protein